VSHSGGNAVKPAVVGPARAMDRRDDMATAGTPGAAASNPRRPAFTMVRREAAAGYVFLLPWLIGFLWFVLGPVLVALGMSFTDYGGGSSALHFIGLANYHDMLSSDPLFRQSLKVTALFTALTVPLGLCLSLGIAVLLNQKVRLLPVWRTIFYLPSLVTGAAIALLWQFMFNEQFGLLNSVLNTFNIQGVPWLSSEDWVIPSLVIASLWGSTNGMLVFLSGLQAIPTDLYEASMLDGAGALRRFQHVTLPLLTPTIFYNLILGIITSFQVFTLVFVLTTGMNGGSVGGPNYASYVYSIYIYQTAFQFNRLGYASALGWALFVVVLLLTVAIFRSARYWVFYPGDE
jgi:multiple sugar transport system permease protein